MANPKGLQQHQATFLARHVELARRHPLITQLGIGSFKREAALEYLLQYGNISASKLNTPDGRRHRRSDIATGKTANRLQRRTSKPRWERDGAEVVLGIKLAQEALVRTFDQACRRKTLVDAEAAKVRALVRTRFAERLHESLGPVARFHNWSPSTRRAVAGYVRSLTLGAQEQVSTPAELDDNEVRSVRIQFVMACYYLEVPMDTLAGQSERWFYEMSGEFKRHRQAHVERAIERYQTRKYAETRREVTRRFRSRQKAKATAA